MNNNNRNSGLLVFFAPVTTTATCRSDGPSPGYPRDAFVAPRLRWGGFNDCIVGNKGSGVVGDAYTDDGRGLGCVATGVVDCIVDGEACEVTFAVDAHVGAWSNSTADAPGVRSCVTLSHLNLHELNSLCGTDRTIAAT